MEKGQAAVLGRSHAWKLTRRTFLVACLAGCSQLARRSTAERPAEQTWALISDTHIGSSRDLVVRGSCMAENLERVVADVASAGPDHVLVNGDLALAAGEQADYATFRELVAPLAGSGMQLHFIPGNHDNREHLIESLSPLIGDATPDQAVPGKVVCSRTIGGIHWIFLDSLEQVDTLPGRLGLEQLQWLAREIDSNRAPAIVCLHHNPSRSLTGLRDAEEFLGIILPRRRVKAVIFGHTHELRLRQTEGLHFVNLPACGYCLLVKPNVPLGWVRASVRPDGMRLEFRGVTPVDRDHGKTFNLSWRGEAPAEPHVIRDRPVARDPSQANRT